MATNATELQKYFADMDAAEEADAASQDANVDDLRFTKRQKQREQEYLDAYGMPMETKPFVQVPPSMRSPEMKDDNKESFAAMAPMAERLMASRKQGLPTTGVDFAPLQGLPTTGVDFASLQKLMSSGSLASPIPIASAPVKTDAPTPVKGTIAPTTSTSSAPPVGTSSTVKPPPVEAGSGGDDEMASLRTRLGLLQAFEGVGSAASGKNLRTDGGILVDRMKQIEALRAKKLERQEGLDVERSQNEQTLNAYQAQFPELRETLEPLRGQTGKPAFQGLLRDIVAARKARTGERALDIREQGMQDIAEYRAGTLGLKRDIAKDNEKYRAVQAGLKQAELDLRQAENARKAVGAAEPSTKERSAFQTMMKPAENTAVALRDADTLNSLGEGMLVTGQPPAFLSRADIAAFNGVPFGQASRSRLAQSNPQAYDLLTKMAEIKTIIGHEYFGSALSPSEAERQRQFMDFSALDSPESLAKKMKNYHDTLSNKATVFLRPRVVNSPLGAEWLQSTGLDALSGEGGTFAGLLDAPKAAAPKAAEAKAPTTVIAPAAKKVPSARSIEELKKNADNMARQEFDEIFGLGAAAKALGE